MKPVNKDDLSEVVENMQSQIDELLLRIKALEDRTYEEVTDGISE